MSEPTPFFRADALFISWERRKALNMIAKASGLTSGDELADTVLKEWLATNHPDVVAHLLAQKERDEDFKKSLVAKLTPTLTTGRI